MALDKVKQGVIADDAVGSSQIAPDTVVAADIGANAITASELADNAVDTAAIASNAVTTAKITDANITTAKVANSAITSLKLGDVIDTVPHIVPGILYPGYDDKQIDGTTALAASTTGPAGSTVASSKYGTVQSDGRMYYYTDIKGSKSIKDPRIGAHFGSQRHKMKSLQLLEQETANHGKNIYSVDGREWCRGHLGGTSNGSDSGELVFLSGTSSFVEIVGFFSDANIQFHNILGRNVRYTLDGTDDSTDYAGGVSLTTPLAGRYVEAGGVENLGLGATLGIHTLKIRQTTSGHGNYMIGFDLIAQDTSSTANRSKIQIPAQNVVSADKKFSISATATHYDPFNGMSAGSNEATTNTFIDLDTSLGMDQWKGGTANYYRPFNGGRVVKWVNSSGTIKTSVTMMPPNADNIGSTVSNSLGNTEITNGTNNHIVNFTNNGTATEYTTRYQEIAKMFHVREFGSGAANGGVGATWADASMLAGAKDEIGYVMDDGLTSLSGIDVHISSGNFVCYENADFWYVTFIGTGITFTSGTWGAGIYNIAQNLPYGTHILKVYRDSTAHPTITIDGVDVQGSSNIGTYGNANEFTFHQPKRPPIPDDAVVLADYMLMADFVIKTGLDPKITSKGVLRKECSRDIYYSGGDHSIAINGSGGSGGIFLNTSASSSAGDRFGILTSFGTNYSVTGYDVSGRSDIDLNGSSATVTNVNTGSAHSTFAHLTNNTTLGINEFKIKNKANGRITFAHFESVSPIHTSHHYQPFETPLLYELIGGDRNMEQTNLVCSSDGKTWDEVTRDTSYIGGNRDTVFNRTNDTGAASTAQWVVDEIRGMMQQEEYGQKNFAPAGGDVVCLKDGTYIINYGTHHGSSNHLEFKINGSAAKLLHSGGSTNSYMASTFRLKRGDILTFFGGWSHPSSESYLSVLNIEKA